MGLHEREHSISGYDIMTLDEGQLGTREPFLGHEQVRAKLRAMLFRGESDSYRQMWLQRSAIEDIKELLLLER